MANMFTNLFTRKKIQEQVVESTKKEDVIDIELRPSTTKINFAAQDFSTTDEAKLMMLYRQMDKDSIISAALDLYADNATQVNTKTGHVVSVESTDKKFQDELNDFLWNIVKIDTEAWQYVRDVARDGKIFLDTKSSEGSRAWSFVPVDEVSTIKPLISGQDDIKYYVITPDNQKNDETLNIGPLAYGYKRQDETGGSGSYIIEPNTRFISGFNTREIQGKMVVEVERAIGGEKKLEEYKIKSGRSMLAPVIQTWQTLSALEDAMFINRLTKSTQFKIVQIDVSESTNKQAQQIIKSVQDAFRSSETIDQTAERYMNRQAPMPINDFIYVPVKGVKGQVTVTPVGGEVGEIDTSDIDFYRNKLFAGLGVLKAYLGFEETTPGGLGDNTMTKLDERLGRRVLRIQQVLKHIVIQLIEYYWKHSVISRAKEEIPEYKVILGKVSTKEEQENRNRLQESINIASSFVSMTQNELFQEFVNPEKLFRFVFRDLIGIDLKAIDNQPEEDEIVVKMHKLSESIRGQARQDKKRLNMVSSNYGSFLEGKAASTLKSMIEEYDIFVEKGGKEYTLEEILEKPSYKAIFNEATYNQLKDMAKSEDPVRIKKSKKITARYTGIDKDSEHVTFTVSAEDPKKNKEDGKPTSYKVRIALKDLQDLVSNNEKEDKKLTDSQLVRDAIKGDLDVSCTCPAAKYWGQQYRGTKYDYSLDKNDIAPKRNIPTQVICKHTILALTVLPFWYNTILRDLRNAGIMNKKVKDKKADKE